MTTSHLSVSQLLERLTLVHWSNSSPTSVLLSELQIQHGFTGYRASAGIPSLAPHHVRQVHGRALVHASTLTAHTHSAAGAERPAADALYSREGHRIGIKTADCLPVLVASSDGIFVAAIHAGWRGLTAGILFKGIDAANRHSSLEDFRFVIGPAISREAFEVGPEVVEALREPSCGLGPDSWALAVSKGQSDRWHVDLSVAAALHLIIAGVAPHNIEVLRACTVRDTRDELFLWNSFRRDGKGCDSNWSWIQGHVVK
jgi:polyphenol oxidase